MLSGRQLAVARLLASGMTKAEAAKELGVTVSTVDNHTRMVYAKLGVKNAVQLTHWLVQNGLYEIPGVRITIPKKRGRPPKAV